MGLISSEYEVSELLEFEKEYLGYFIHSPLDTFHCTGGLSIKNAKETAIVESVALMEGVITSVSMTKTKKETLMCRLVINDGYEDALLILWEDNIKAHNTTMLAEGVGVQACVRYDEKRNSFTLARGTIMMRLVKKDLSVTPVSAELALAE